MVALTKSIHRDALGMKVLGSDSPGALAHFKKHAQPPTCLDADDEALRHQHCFSDTHLITSSSSGTAVGLVDLCF